MARPRKSLDPERRDRLLRHTRSHFAVSGFNAASVNEILTAASFARSSFYYFFGTKNTLFDAAFADGLEKLARVVDPPDPATLDTNSFWPAILRLIDELTQAGHDLDLTTVAAMFHLTDAPQTPSLEGFRDAVQQWCFEIVRRGRALGHLDQELPDDLYQELVWSIVVAVDRWVARDPTNAKHSGTLVRQLLIRMVSRQ